MCKSSTPVPKKEAAPVVDQSTKVTEVSTGFHVFELHLPTLGHGILWLILLIALIIVVVIFYRWCQRRWTRRSNPSSSSPRTDFPVVYYVGGSREGPALPQPHPRIFELPPDDSQPGLHRPAQPSSGPATGREARRSTYEDGTLHRAWRGETASEN